MLTLTWIQTYKVKSQWILRGSMPRALCSSGIGSYQNTIYIIGGYNYTKQLTEYDISTGLFVYQSEFFTPTSVNFQGNAQWWVQIGQILYMRDRLGEYLHTFDLSSKQFTAQLITPPNNTMIPAACLAASIDEQLLYYLGGYNLNYGVYLKTLQILNISSNVWLTQGPVMNRVRGYLSCITASNGKLYAFGGLDVKPVDSIEYIHTTNIYDNALKYIKYTLPSPSLGTRAVKYSHYVFIIGGVGYDYTDKVCRIDTITDRLTILSDQLIDSLSDTMPIIVNETIYAFGGLYGSPLNLWQTYTIDTNPSPSPTAYVPTEHQTSIPTTQEPTSVSTFEAGMINMHFLTNYDRNV